MNIYGKHGEDELNFDNIRSQKVRKKTLITGTVDIFNISTDFLDHLN